MLHSVGLDINILLGYYCAKFVYNYLPGKEAALQHSLSTATCTHVEQASDTSIT
jgi:hypothetical protein